MSQQPDQPEPQAGPYGAPSSDQAPGYGQQAPDYGQQYGQPQGQQYGQQYGQAAPGGSGTEMSPQDQRLWACLAHVSAIVAGILLSSFTGGLVYLGVVGPLVLFFVFRGRGVFVRRQVTEALNFQITLTAVYLALLLLGIVLGVLTLGLALLVIIPVAAVVGVVALVFAIIAAVRANQGVDYRYPLTWRVVR